MRTTERQTRDHEPSVDEMRHDIAERELQFFLDNPSDLIELLKHGCVGLEERADIEIRDEYSRIFGED